MFILVSGVVAVFLFYLAIGYLGAVLKERRRARKNANRSSRGEPASMQPSGRKPAQISLPRRSFSGSHSSGFDPTPRA
jgi:hypothetical protein